MERLFQNSRTCNGCSHLSNAKWKGPVSDSGSLAGSAEDDNRLRGFRLQAQLLE
jgi:hypothetical protein